MTNNNKHDSKLSNNIITADMTYAHKDGRVDFMIRIPGTNVNIADTFKNLNDVVRRVLLELKRIPSDDLVSTIRDHINNAYHRYMKNVLDRIIERRVYFTGGTLYDYQCRYL